MKAYITKQRSRWRGNLHSMTKINRLFPPCELCDGVTMMSEKGRILLDLEKRCSWTISIIAHAVEDLLRQTR